MIIFPIRIHNNLVSAECELISGISAVHSAQGKPKLFSICHAQEYLEDYTGILAVKNPLVNGSLCSMVTREGTY